MKNSYYVRLSSTEIGILDLCPVEKGRGLIITRINIPEKFRGRGHGSRLLSEVLADADREQIPLFLEILATGPLNRDDLMKWYARHGFRGSDPMFRRPRRLETMVDTRARSSSSD